MQKVTIKRALRGGLKSEGATPASYTHIIYNKGIVHVGIDKNQVMLKIYVKSENFPS